jgi:hypothetical protein
MWLLIFLVGCLVTTPVVLYIEFRSGRHEVNEHLDDSAARWW